MELLGASCRKSRCRYFPSRSSTKPTTRCFETSNTFSDRGRSSYQRIAMPTIKCENCGAGADVTTDGEYGHCASCNTVRVPTRTVMSRSSLPLT